MDKKAAVIGGGLAGCECALRLAKAGIAVRLFEMRPETATPAHETDLLGELVCSNSFRSDEPEAAVGVLKQEMRDLGSAVMRAASETEVPAGKALAVDRSRFARTITRMIEDEPNITLVRREITTLDDPELAGFDAVVLAAGPLASDALSENLASVLGSTHLYFYDAIAPIVETESVDMEHAFWASRWKPEEKDYLNCPMTEEEYKVFHTALMEAEKVVSRDFEKEIHFEGCMPVEALAERGEETLLFGPLKPVGLEDPRTGERPFAVLQLRPENTDKTAMNLVGCQTKLKYPEQKRVFGLIPALRSADFLRFGSMHRNTYVNAPEVLDGLTLKNRPDVYLAGQITGVEGYVESAACGLWAGHLLAARLTGSELPEPPAETALGALLAHLRTPAKNFQPSNVQFGLTPPLGRRLRKRDRKAAYAARAREAFATWLSENNMSAE